MDCAHPQRFAHLFREPGSEEGHLEGVGVGMEGVEGLRTHGAHHGEYPAGEVVADCKDKNTRHGDNLAETIPVTISENRIMRR